MVVLVLLLFIQFETKFKEKKKNLYIAQLAFEVYNKKHLSKRTTNVVNVNLFDGGIFEDIQAKEEEEKLVWKNMLIMIIIDDDDG